MFCYRLDDCSHESEIGFRIDVFDKDIARPGQIRTPVPAMAKRFRDGFDRLRVLGGDIFEFPFRSLTVYDAISIDTRGPDAQIERFATLNRLFYIERNRRLVGIELDDKLRDRRSI